jgi:hypothetical protein
MSSPFVWLRPHASALLVPFTVASIGCAYPPRAVTELSPGRNVILELTDAGVVDMAPRLGQGVFLVAGTLQVVDSTSVILAVTRTESTHGALYSSHPGVVSWDGDVVTIPRADIANTREQHVSAPFVVLVGASLALAAVTTVYIVSHAHLATQKLTLPKLPNVSNPLPVAR